MAIRHLGMIRKERSGSIESNLHTTRPTVKPGKIPSDSRIDSRVGCDVEIFKFVFECLEIIKLENKAVGILNGMLGKGDR